MLESAIGITRVAKASENTDSPGTLEHFPEKWSPVFRQKMRPPKRLEYFAIQLDRKAL
jgi:hypothetical protein